MSRPDYSGLESMYFIYLRCSVHKLTPSVVMKGQPVHDRESEILLPFQLKDLL